MIFRTLVAYIIFYRFWWFFFQETHTEWPQKVNLWAAILRVHTTGPLLLRIPPPPGGTAILPEYIHYYG
jgi:hypothetical protein